MRTGIARILLAAMTLASPGLSFAQFARILRFDGPVDINPQRHCRITSVSLDDDTRNRRLWQVDFPPRMANLVRDTCDFGRMNLGEDLPWAGLVETVHVRNLLVVADQTGFLLINYEAGKLLGERATQVAPKAVFDSATFALEGAGLQPCKGSASQVVLRACGDRIVFFNGTSAALIDAKTMKVEAEGKWKPPPAKTPAKIEKGKRLIPGTVELGTVRLSFVGKLRVTQ